MFVMKKYTWLLMLILFFGSCTAYKKVPYVAGAETISIDDFSKAAKNYEAVIMPKDIISITVNTPTNAASKDFNLPLIPSGGGETGAILGAVDSNQGALQNYIVDNDGYISFPVLGKLKISGLTKKEAENKIYAMIYPLYVKEEPIVNIRFLNYKITVLGEVAKPGVYTTSNEQMSIFDALALAGDLTIYGKRDNVLLVRENENGERRVQLINLHDKNLLLNNDIYYLQQNDKLYIQPNRARGNSSQIGSVESLTLSGVSLVIAIVSLLLR